MSALNMALDGICGVWLLTLGTIFGLLAIIQGYSAEVEVRRERNSEGRKKRD